LPDQKILGFDPRDSLRPQNNAFNKTIGWHKQLRIDLGFSPGKTLNFSCDAAPTCILLLRAENTKQILVVAEVSSGSNVWLVASHTLLPLLTSATTRSEEKVI
jgi:hypothetical protein